MRARGCLIGFFKIDVFLNLDCVILRLILNILKFAFKCIEAVKTASVIVLDVTPNTLASIKLWSG